MRINGENNNKMKVYLDSICDLINPNLGVKERMKKKSRFQIADTAHPVPILSKSRQELANLQSWEGT